MSHRVTGAGLIEFTLKHYDEFAKNTEAARRAYEIISRLVFAKRVVLTPPEKPREFSYAKKLAAAWIEQNKCQG